MDLFLGALLYMEREEERSQRCEKKRNGGSNSQEEEEEHVMNDNCKRGLKRIRVRKSKGG
jgi:hypothetical protein